jgi:hypothetical protein
MKVDPVGDLIGLSLIVLILAGAFFGMAHLGRSRKPLTQAEYERGLARGGGVVSASVFAGMYAIGKLLHPKAVEAIEVQRDLRAGHYDIEQEAGEGNDTGHVEDEARAGGVSESVAKGSNEAERLRCQNIFSSRAAWFQVSAKAWRHPRLDVCSKRAGFASR